MHIACYVKFRIWMYELAIGSSTNHRTRHIGMEHKTALSANWMNCMLCIYLNCDETNISFLHRNNGHKARKIYLTWNEIFSESYCCLFHLPVRLEEEKATACQAINNCKVKYWSFLFSMIVWLVLCCMSGNQMALHAVN